MNKKKLDIRRIWTLCAPFHRQLLIVVAFLMAHIGIMALFPIIIGAIVTSVTNNDERGLIIAVLSWIGLGTLRTILVYIRERFEVKNIDYEISRHLSNLSIGKFFYGVSSGQHRRGHSAIRKNVIQKGESAVGGIVSMSVYDMLPICLMILFPLTFLLFKVPLVGVTVLLAMICYTLYTLKYNTSFFPRMKKLDTANNNTYKKRSEFIDNAAVVFVNAQEKSVQKKCDDTIVEFNDKARPFWLSYICWIHSGQIFITISQALCLMLAGYLSFRGKLSAGEFVTVSIWINNGLGTLQNITYLQRNIMRTVAPIHKYFKFLDFESDIKVIANPIPIHKVGEIEFKNVSFTYRPREETDSFNKDDDEDEGTKSVEEIKQLPAVHNLSFKLEEGKIHAFVGLSGSGKSTTAALILREFDPESGEILINGVDLKKIDFRELRKKAGVVPQDVAMFDDTIQGNVTFGLNGEAEKVTREDLDNIAKLSKMDEFQHKLEKGWDTIIGERGIKLSGGERQRVGIARALIKNPDLLIFDEATSSLDTVNEFQIRASIMKASKGKTTVVIAHRLATVKDADKIFVFENGTIVGEGTHVELLNANEAYQRLVANQVVA